MVLRHRFYGFHINSTRGSCAKDCRDALSDFPPEYHRQNGDADHKEKADAILGQQERETVRQIDLCQVHVDGVGGDEDDGEAEDDCPVRIGTGASAGWRVPAVAGPADEQTENGEEALKVKKKYLCFEYLILGKQ